MNRIGRSESIVLDLIRGLACQLVLLGHFISFNFPENIIGTKIPIQNLGVVIFFILSGYLIFTAAARCIDFRTFFLARFSRIYVTYIPCLIVIAALDFAVSKYSEYKYTEAFNIVNFVGNLLMLQDYPLNSLMRVFGLQWNITSFASGRPLWTLAVEWWLYMFFGWLYLKIIRMSDYSFRSLLILLVLSIAPIAHATFARGESLTLMFMLGAVIAVFSTQIGVLKTYVWALLFALSVTLFTLRIIHSNNFYDLQGAIFIAVAFGALIGLARATRVIEDLPRHVISTIKLLAGMSYALYATHYSIIEFIRVWSIEVEYSLILFVLCSHVVAFVIYFVFDRNHKRFAMFLGRNVWKTSNA